MNSSTEQPNSRGRNVGGRIWGLWEVIHGLGDSIRGTALGAIDTMTHSDSRKYDTIASEGRAEMQRGLANLAGRPPQYEPDSAVNTVAPNHDQHSVPTEQSSMFAAPNYDRDPNALHASGGGMKQRMGTQTQHGALPTGSHDETPALPPRPNTQGYGTIR
ncbi:hypothetical protein BKA70DRAFT_1300848 [Coprinopsis sp. MPI-PUGE-AT-0042]|nr:hypothetical protein BKA70DRAFT_1300848 [Coprinopsis sp. MPI-PUGE-AT-0042]